MYILNTSFMVEPEAHDGWYKLLINRFLPEVRKAGLGPIKFCRVLGVVAEDHHTYSLQVELDDMLQYKEFTEDLFPQYTEIAGPIYGEKVLHFATLMKKIEIE